ncbi:hypothetical protein ACFYUJ_11195 [Streptomyces sp. NPDC004520]|uniref:hypothetical protein n=1 Tax=Streptomyces sp. NPDC004520 TaxID=3364702 RepID=UPI0036A891C3
MKRSARSCHDRVIAVAAALALAATGAVAAVAPPAAAASTVSVSVDAALQLATVPATGVGVNIPVYDAAMNAPATPGLLGTAGINTVRYPGGSHSDVYHWQTGTADDGAYAAPNTGFDAFMGTVRAAGAQPVITANYGSGTPRRPPPGSGTPTSPRATASSTGKSATRSTATASTAPSGSTTPTAARAPRPTRTTCSSTSRR